MNWQSVVCISVGAAIGAHCRWGLTNWCLGSTWFSGHRLPWGTLLANVIGGYLIGVVIASFVRWPNVPTEVRLGLVTGFLGALTTFSSFSNEVVTFLTSRDYRWAAILIVLHVAGSLTATLLGLWSFRICFR